MHGTDRTRSKDCPKMKISSRYIRAVYSFWAHIYDSIIDPLFRFDRRKAIHALNIKKGDHVLEVGVGTGLNLPHYPALCHVMGIDFSSAMLKKSKSKKSKARVELREGDARELPFGKNTFDKALTTYVLRVSPEPHKIMRDVSRVVKKGGMFVVVDQFKGKNNLLLTLAQPFKLLLGWGKEHDINDLIKGTPWVIQSSKRMGLMPSTRLVVLKNMK